MPGPETKPRAAHQLENLDEIAEVYARRAAELPDPERRHLRDELVDRAMPFARRLAGRYRNRGEPVDDLVQVASLGLVKAVDRYDPGRGSFTAYAMATISGEIKRHFRDRTWGVHVPRRLQDLSLAIGHGTTVLTNVLSRTPTTAELAAYLQTDEAEIAAAIESSAGYTPSSLNMPVGDGGGEIGDLMGSVDPGLALVDDRLTVARLLLRLPARERRLLALRFYGNHTQSQIAAELGISQMHVSRLLTRALTWLREAMLSDVPPPWEGASEDLDHRLHLQVSAGAGVVTVRVRGEVDRDNAEQLRRALLDATSARAVEQLVVDFTAMPLIDAAGIGVLLAVHEAARVRDTKVRVVGLQPHVAHIVAVSGLGALLE